MHSLLLTGGPNASANAWLQGEQAYQCSNLAQKTMLYVRCQHGVQVKQTAAPCVKERIQLMSDQQDVTERRDCQKKQVDGQHRLEHTCCLMLLHSLSDFCEPLAAALQRLLLSLQRFPLRLLCCV